MDLDSSPFKPYTPPDGNLVDVVAPLLIFGLVAAMTALPIYEIVGLGRAAVYGIWSFILLCYLRKWMLEAPTLPERFVRPSIHVMSMNYLSVLVPGFAWVVISLATATAMGGWTPTFVGQ